MVRYASERWYPVSGPVFSVISAAEEDDAEKGGPRVIYCGGGGSSKTGVGNSIILARVGKAALETLGKLDTGVELCASIAFSDQGLLVACFGALFRCYQLRIEEDDEDEAGTFKLVSQDHVADTKDSLNACSLKAGLLATAGDDGHLRLWTLPEKDKDWLAPLTFLCKGHTASLTDVSFAPAGHVVCTASKDGTCRVWSAATGLELCVLDTRRGMPKPPPPQKNKRARPNENNVVCRSCRFGDDAGSTTLFSVQSTSRGAAHVTKWLLTTEEETTLTATAVKVKNVSQQPVSAMAVQGGSVICGDVEGIVGVWDESLGSRLAVSQAHELPVTSLVCVEGYALSSSADGKVVLTNTTPKPSTLASKLFLVLLLLVLLFLGWGGALAS